MLLLIFVTLPRFKVCDTPNTGRFGRNCGQTCHCADGNDKCLWDTGDCEDGCEEGWKGLNCQGKWYVLP